MKIIGIAKKNTRRKQNLKEKKNTSLVYIIDDIHSNKRFSEFNEEISWYFQVYFVCSCHTA